VANGNVGDVTHGAYFMIENEVPGEQNEVFAAGEHVTLPLTHFLDACVLITALPHDWISASLVGVNWRVRFSLVAHDGMAKIQKRDA
jgi:hypothetical protein